MPAVSEHLNVTPPGYGWWMVSLATQLARRGNVSLAISWFSPLLKKAETFNRGDITYFCYPYRRQVESITHYLSTFPKLRKIYHGLTQKMGRAGKLEIQRCLEIIETYKPDVVHIHGTENFYGLVTPHTKKPVVISLQGLLSKNKDDFWGNISGLRRLKFPQEFYLWRGMVLDSRTEKKIIRANRFFIGRTAWDKQCLSKLNQQAEYFHCDEIMRENFYHHQWHYSSLQEHILYTTTKGLPLKGLSLLIDAVSLLLPSYPKIKLRVGGPISNTGYGQYLRQRVNSLNLLDQIEFLGHKEENEIIRELLNAHVFVIPSLIENSPNSLVEAQLIGIPVVASSVGGIPSLVMDGETGLLFPKGDVAALAQCISKLFENLGLATKIGSRAQKIALMRNDPISVAQDQENIYHKLLSPIA
jgi:glycosyltransferase involved in cell wall biosynthesis